MSRRGLAARAIFAALALAALPLAAPAAADTLRLAVTPGAPFVDETPRLDVSGTIATACDPAQVHAAAHAPTGFDGTYQIAVDLVDDCASSGPGAPQPFATSVPLGTLAPGAYGVTVHLPLDVGSQSTSFTVYQHGTAAVALPPLSTDDAPGALVVSFEMQYQLSSAVAFVEVQGSVVRVDYGSRPFVSSTVPPGTVPAVVTVPLPPLAAGDYEVRLIGAGGFQNRTALHVWRHDRCLPGEDVLCLQDGRFRVSATWRDFAGRSGAAYAQPLAGNDGSGLLWFFSADNPELTVKALDGCGVNEHWWVFLASGSTVEYTVTVEDTTTGKQQIYRNDAGTAAPLTDDTVAFACP